VAAASQPIAGQASDIGQAAASGEDETTAAYRALHAEKVVEFERNKALATQAAAAGNTDISASYAKAAQEAYKMANDISLLAIKHNEPAADTSEIKNYEYGQTHPGFATRLELREIGPDQYGRPQYGTFNSQTGEITPYKPPAAARGRGNGGPPRRLTLKPTLRRPASRSRRCRPIRRPGSASSIRAFRVT
jgi:hypothetical protein